MYMKQKKKSLFSLLLALMMVAGLMQGMTVETKAATNSGSGRTIYVVKGFGDACRRSRLYLCKIWIWK